MLPLRLFHEAKSILSVVGLNHPLKLYRCHFWSQSMPQILLKMLPDELTAACPWRLPLCLSPRLSEPLQPVLAASDSIFYATRVISSTARRLLT